MIEIRKTSVSKFFHKDDCRWERGNGLYFQNMLVLLIQNTQVYELCKNVLRVIRRTDRNWAGIGTDVVIEQVLIRSLKTVGR